MRPRNLPPVNRSGEKLLHGLGLWALGSSRSPSEPRESSVFSLGTLSRSKGHIRTLCRGRPCPKPNLQHSMGLDAVCRETILPLDSGMCTRNTRRTRVFFLPMSVSPLRSSMSAFRSFRIPAQSMLWGGGKPWLELSISGKAERSPTRPPYSVNQNHSTATYGGGGRRGGSQSTVNSSAGN